MPDLPPATIRDVIKQIMPIAAHAVAVFGDDANQTPSAILATEGGLLRIDDILTRIEHNIPE